MSFEIVREISYFEFEKFSMTAVYVVFLMLPASNLSLNSHKRVQRSQIWLTIILLEIPL